MSILCNKSLNMKFTYRPEIDGLRAIAVTAVIIYHAQVNFFGTKIYESNWLQLN